MGGGGTAGTRNQDHTGKDHLNNYLLRGVSWTVRSESWPESRAKYQHLKPAAPCRYPHRARRAWDSMHRPLALLVALPRALTCEQHRKARAACERLTL